MDSESKREYDYEHTIEAMKRYAIEKLKKWKDHPFRKPLLLMGARQVGKTWLMQEFGRLYFKNVAYIRFDNSERARRAFCIDFDIPRLLEAISIEGKCVVEPQNTLIILDEIQECPAALTSLKYFCEEAREYAVVAAGALLGVADHVGTGFPVGKVDLLNLYPMSFWKPPGKPSLRLCCRNGIGNSSTTLKTSTSAICALICTWAECPAWCRYTINCGILKKYGRLSSICCATTARISANTRQANPNPG